MRLGRAGILLKPLNQDQDQDQDHDQDQDQDRSGIPKRRSKDRSSGFKAQLSAMDGFGSVSTVLPEGQLNCFHT